MDRVECWQCGGCGTMPGCFEDTCSCFGDPDDPDLCCSPRKCDVCRGKGGWEQPEPASKGDEG